MLQDTWNTVGAILQKKKITENEISNDEGADFPRGKTSSSTVTEKEEGFLF